jgi:putative endonuclease
LVFHVYILQSESTGGYYIGQTQDLPGRLAYHNAGYSVYTRNRGPWKLVHSESYATRSEAVLREQTLKSHKDRSMIQKLLSASRSI